MTQFEGTLEGAYETYEKELTDNVLVALAVEYQAYDYTLQNPTLHNSALAMYENSDMYEEFRAKCGDKYLSTITTGGMFVGLVEIVAKNNEDKRDIYVGLSGKVTAGTVQVSFEGNFTSNLKEIEQTHNTRIEIFSKGGVMEHKLVTSVDEFFESAETFLDSLNYLMGEQPDDLSQLKEVPPYQNGAFLAKFEPYESLTYVQKGGDIIIKKARMDEYVYYSSLYDNYLNKIEYIQVNYHEYVDAEEKDEILRELSKQLIIQKSRLTALARECAQPQIIGEEMKTADQKCPALSTFNDENTTVFMDEWDILDILPLEAIEYPRTCDDRKRIFGSSTDGEYRVYMEANKSKPYNIYCDGMNTDEPQEYLTLKNISPLSDHPSFNYSRYSSFYNIDDPDQEVDLVSIYKKLKVEISYDHVSVFDTQDQFVESVGGEVLEEKIFDIDDNTTVINTALFGNARNISRKAKGAANVNSAGTQFRISPRTEFVQVAQNISGESLFKLVKDSVKTWSEAELYAESLGGHLVTIDSASKQLEVMEFMQQEDPTRDVLELWIGLNSLQFANQLEWVAPDTFYDYGAWASNQPNNDSETRCVSMDLTDEYRWSKVDCSEQKNFLIEFSNSVEDAVVEMSDDRTDVFFNSTGENGHVRSEGDLILEYY